MKKLYLLLYYAYNFVQSLFTYQNILYKSTKEIASVNIEIILMPLNEICNQESTPQINFNMFTFLEETEEEHCIESVWGFHIQHWRYCQFAKDSEGLARSAHALRDITGGVCLQ